MAELVGWLVSLLGLLFLAMTSLVGKGPRRFLRYVWNGQFSRFSAFGAIGTIAHYTVLVSVVALLGESAVLGATCGAVVGALINYLLNYRFTFSSSLRHRDTLPRFLLMAGVGVLMNALIVGVLTAAGLHYMIAQVVATLTVLLINYLVSKKWIFRDQT